MQSIEEDSHGGQLLGEHADVICQVYPSVDCDLAAKTPIEATDTGPMLEKPSPLEPDPEALSPEADEGREKESLDGQAAIEEGPAAILNFDEEIERLAAAIPLSTEAQATANIQEIQRLTVLREAQKLSLENSKAMTFATVCDECCDDDINLGVADDGGTDADSAVDITRKVPWPSPIAEEGLHGVLGDIVRTIAPHTESDPNALLLQSMVIAGHLMGIGSYFQVESNRHSSNEFVVLVGATADSRKGTSLARAGAVGEAALGASPKDPNGVNQTGGMGSGEALTWRLRNQQNDGQLTDEEVSNRKRILIVESEYSHILKVASRDGNTTSQIYRYTWDGVGLSNVCKGQELVATGHHVSIIGHITSAELKELLKGVDIANGSANRHIFAVVRRSKYLPEGGDLHKNEIQRLGSDLRNRLEWIKPSLKDGQNGPPCLLPDERQVIRDAEAKLLWAHIYPSLSNGQLGIAGEILARGEAHVTRISLIYALLDRSAVVRVEHLLAALAVWDYSVRSVRYLFCDSLGNIVADIILANLRKTEGGLTRTDISHSVLQRNRTAIEIKRALKLLEDQRLAYRVQERQPGVCKPTERWFSGDNGSKVVQVVGRPTITPGMSYLDRAKAYLQERSSQE